MNPIMNPSVIVDAELERMLLPVSKLNKDIVKASALNKKEARFTVDLYYQLQDCRIRNQAQLRSLVQGADDGPAQPEILRFFFEQFETLEEQMKKALLNYSKRSQVGNWLLSVCGIGAVISAGLLANIDIYRAPYAGHIWSFAGLTRKTWHGREKAKALIGELKGAHDNALDGLRDYLLVTGKSVQSLVYTITAGAQVLNQEAAWAYLQENPDMLDWEFLQKQAERRPWSAKFKSLCAYIIGESFVKTQSLKSGFYGSLYAAKKVEYMTRNERGDFADYAAEELRNKKYSSTTDAYKAYSHGVFPPAHIHAMARRWTVRLFLAHLHQVMWEDQFNKPAPLPYIIEVGGHGKDSYVSAPNWQQIENSAIERKFAIGGGFDKEQALQALKLEHYHERACILRAERKAKAKTEEEADL